MAIDPVLKKYPELLSFIEKTIKYEADFDHSNPENKRETAVIEIVEGCCDQFSQTVHKHRLEYLYEYNWRDGEVRLYLVWYNTNEKGLWVWDTYSDCPFSDRNREVMNSLAKTFGLEHLPLEHFTRFMIIFLSRMVQTNWINLEDHGIYVRLHNEK